MKQIQQFAVLQEYVDDLLKLLVTISRRWILTSQMLIGFPPDHTIKLHHAPKYSTDHGLSIV